jgi:hypothetical protein
MAGSCAVRLDAGHRLSDVVEWVVGASRARSPAGPYLRRPMLITPPAPPPHPTPPPHVASMFTRVRRKLLRTIHDHAMTTDPSKYARMVMIGKLKKQVYTASQACQDR